MAPPPLQSGQRRFPCPCKPCRTDHRPYGGMQTRQTISVHMRAQAKSDRDSGRVLSDEEYAKICSLLHTAGLQEKFYSSTRPLAPEQLPNIATNAEVIPEVPIHTTAGAGSLGGRAMPIPPPLASGGLAHQAEPHAPLSNANEDMNTVAEGLPVLLGPLVGSEEGAHEPEPMELGLGNDLDYAAHWEPSVHSRSVSPAASSLRAVSVENDGMPLLEQRLEPAADELGGYMLDAMQYWSAVCRKF
ncbi:hypothetical protein C2E23DRAFT_594235 [Lenzites betulinus]|nr:hypothetical protein C2E23DRAFT_594235 [Lenzites betulinus]